MAKCKFEINERGLIKTLQSKEMLDLTREYAEKVHPGKEYKSFVGYDRAKTIVYDKKSGKPK